MVYRLSMAATLQPCDPGKDDVVTEMKWPAKALSGPLQKQFANSWLRGRFSL